MQGKIRLTEGASVQAGSATRGTRTEMQFRQLKLAIEKNTHELCAKLSTYSFRELGLLRVSTSGV